MRISAPAPDGVTLTRDAHGVPHIRAADLGGAVWGMGYCHALDRGMQMCMMRILGQGRAAECLDGSDETVAIDRFFRRMNWAGRMEGQMALLEPGARAMVDAYCAGVNARFAEGRPWEFRLLGYAPEPWRPEDCLLIARMTGYLTLAQSQAEIERLFIELVQGGVPDDKLADLFPGCFTELDRALVESIRLHERLVPEGLKWASAAPRMMASNNWVVGPARSRSGAALLSNDPHLEVNRLPNVWVEQVVELPEDTVMTATMPGLPAALVGRKGALAWGATYTFMDAVDSWVEDCRDGCFRRGDDAWLPFETRTETIRRKKGAPVEVTFHENLHGTLEGDPSVPGRYLATRWAPSDSGAESINAAFAMWSAQTVDEGMAAVGRIETAWNWVFAARDGTIGYQMSGRCPLRKPGWTGFTPAPGWDPAYDWRGWATPEELPRVVDPDCGYIVTANDDLNHLGVLDPINMPMGDYRARRIAQRLEAGPSDLDTFRALHMDTFSVQADAFLEVLEPVLPAGGAADVLRGWDRRYEPDSRGAALFEAFYQALLVEMFSPDGFGEEVVRHLLDTTGVFIDFYANFDRLLLAETSAWLGERTRASVFRAAFDKVADGEHGVWGDTNRVTLTHILLGGKLPGFLGFDHGPIPLPGGRATPHQGQVYASGGRATSFAPSLRLMADMSTDEMHTALAGGPSDRRFSRWYVSELDRWRRGETKVLRRLDG